MNRRSTLIATSAPVVNETPAERRRARKSDLDSRTTPGGSESPGSHEANAAITRDMSVLYAEALPTTRSGPLYNAFSYPTKISPETIALFIATHTEPGQTVLDTFAGSGTTGLAAKLCANPTPLMLDVSDRLGITPKWGPRHAVLYDVGVMAAFVSRVMCNPPDPARFRAAAEQLLTGVNDSYGWLYATVDPDGRESMVRHVIWSDVLICPHCLKQSTYWHAAVRFDPLTMVDRFDCSECGREALISECERALEVVYDPLLERDISHRKRVPVTVYGRTGTTNWQRSASGEDGCPKAVAEPLPASAPRVQLNWGDLHRAGYHTGITHLHHFYTPRNFLAVAALWDAIGKFDEDLRDSLRLLVLSFNSSHSTLMTRVVAKTNQRDLVLTGAQSGVLYISGLPVEKNVFLGVKRKITTFTQAFELIHSSPSTVEVVNGSSTKLHLPNSSVDYVFTDPPFGDYIPYAEINEINEAWLGHTTDRSAEIVMSQTANKDVHDYAALMAEVFGEISRVMRPSATATVVFHSAESAVWQALTNAYNKAGMFVQTTSVLNKVQASFKQVVSTTTVKGDPLIVLSKEPPSAGASMPTIDGVFEAVVAESKHSTNHDERTKERLYSRFITRCLVNGVPITLGAADFYRRFEIETER